MFLSIRRRSQVTDNSDKACIGLQIVISYIIVLDLQACGPCSGLQAQSLMDIHYYTSTAYVLTMPN